MNLFLAPVKLPTIQLLVSLVVQDEMVVAAQIVEVAVGVQQVETDAENQFEMIAEVQPETIVGMRLVEKPAETQLEMTNS